MVKAGDYVLFHDSVGTVQNVLSDEYIQVAMVHFVGDCEFNIKAISITELVVTNEKTMIDFAFMLIERLCKEIYNSTNSKTLRKKLVELDSYLDYKTRQ